MTSLPWSVRPLTVQEQGLAVDLFEREIAIFTRDQYESDVVERQNVTRWMASRDVPAPPDTWVGAVQDGRVLAAAHAGPHYGQAADVLERQLAGRPGAADPAWLQAYVQQVANLDDVAVAPECRRRGLATAVVNSVCADLRKRGARTVAGYASGSASIGLFEHLGFVIGEERASVPADVANGLRTAWPPSAVVDGRYFWKVLAYPAGASFIKR